MTGDTPHETPTIIQPVEHELALSKPPRRSLLWLHTPWAPALAVLASYGVWLLLCFSIGHQARDFIWIGRHFLDQSHVSSVITYDPQYHGYVPNGVGYDGQFSYFIALDPGNARYYVERSPFPADYRYTRILYPLLARALALGMPALIPYTLLLVNLLAVGGGTLAVAAWLRRKKLSPWLALIYGLYPGLFIAVWRDLTEPVAYGLVALAVYLFDFGGRDKDRRRVLWAGLAFALAALARETTLVFAVLYGLSLLLPISRGPGWRQRLIVKGRDAALLIGTATAPFVSYKLFLRLWLGSFGAPPQVVPRLIPLQGIFAYWPWDWSYQLEVEFVVVPGLVCIALGLWALSKRSRGVEIWALLANALLFVVLLAPGSYADIYASARISMGVVLAAIYCLPAFEKVGKRLLPVFAVACGAWLLMLPIWVIGSLVFWPVH